MEMNENRRIDSGPEELSRRKESGVTENNQDSTDTNTHDTSPIGSFYAEPSPPPSFSNYGKKIQDPDENSPVRCSRFKVSFAAKEACQLLD